MNSRDRYEIIGLRKISHYKITLQKCLPEKSIRNASKFLKQCNTLAKQSRKSNILINSKLLKFQASPKFCQPVSQPACLPAVRLRFARCRPQIFHRLCTVALDLQISWSAKNSSTAQSSFLLTIIGLPSSSLFR